MLLSRDSAELWCLLVVQALASRPDVMPQTYTTALEKLQDQIPPFSDADAMRVVVEELGRPVDSIFSRISASPIAAASLGQVCASTHASAAISGTHSTEVLKTVGRDPACAAVRIPGESHRQLLHMHLRTAHE